MASFHAAGFCAAARFCVLLLLLKVGGWKPGSLGGSLGVDLGGSFGELFRATKKCADFHELRVLHMLIG